MTSRRGGGGARQRLLLSVTTVGALAGSFFALMAVVWKTPGPVNLDRALSRVRRTELLDAVLGEGAPLGFGDRLRPEEVVHLGGKTVVVAVAFGLAVLALAWRDRIGALVAVAGPGLTGALTEYVLKPLVNAPGGPRAFPSGHGGGVAAVALVAVAIVHRRWGWLPALLVAPFAGIPVLLVDSALLRLDYHYPTDVLGGGLLAATVVLGELAVLSLYRGPGHQLLGHRLRGRKRDDQGPHDPDGRSSAAAGEPESHGGDENHHPIALVPKTHGASPRRLLLFAVEAGRCLLRTV